MTLASRKVDAFTESDVELMVQIAVQVAIAVENALAFQQIGELKNKLAKEKLYLEDEIRTEFNFDEIVGKSQALGRILQQIENVAGDRLHRPDSRRNRNRQGTYRPGHPQPQRAERPHVRETELLSHSGGASGKRVVRARTRRIHRSNRSERWVVLNWPMAGRCSWMKSETFHLELQPKLLRVLQEQEFERLGSTRTIHTNVRLVAATNRDLDGMVASREFRSDLFYRLNVFPIIAPPLRERIEDVPLLVRYFAQKLSRRMNKRIETFPKNP